MAVDLTAIAAELPALAPDGRRWRDDAGQLTKAGWREAMIRVAVARGADRENAERVVAFGRLTKSKRGTWAHDIGGGRVAALNAAQCAWLGKQPGPGNF